MGENGWHWRYVVVKIIMYLVFRRVTLLTDAHITALRMGLKSSS